MKALREQEWTGANGLDRKVIQIAAPVSSAGIAAALRRAFAAAATEPSNHDFAALLARLN